MKIRHLVPLMIVILALGCAGMPRGSSSGDGETSWIQTADHWKLALHHYAAHSRRGGPPLVLLPDVYENAAAYDLDADHALARGLADAGIDVTVAELRGQGQSERPTWWNERRADWTFDHYVEQDLPAIVDAVCRARTAPKVVLGGHGFGGLAAVVFAEAKPEKVAGLVGLGVAARLTHLNELHRTLLGKVDDLDWLAEVPAPLGATAPAPFVGSRDSLFDVLLCNGRKLNRQTVADYYAHALVPVSVGVARQIAGWLQHQSCAAYDGRTDYLAGLAKIKCPILLLSGQVDNLIDPADSRDLLDRVGSSDKTQRIFSTANDYFDDYGHAALLIGERATNEVGGYLAEWLASRTWP